MTYDRRNLLNSIASFQSNCLHHSQIKEQQRDTMVKLIEEGKNCHSCVYKPQFIGTKCRKNKKIFSFFSLCYQYKEISRG